MMYVQTGIESKHYNDFHLVLKKKSISILIRRLLYSLVLIKAEQLETVVLSLLTLFFKKKLETVWTSTNNESIEYNSLFFFLSNF